MKQEELAKILEAAPKIGQVEARDFIGFVSIIRSWNSAKGTEVENPYMAVDGRIAMARLDHIKQQGRLDIGPTQVISEDDKAITVMVPIVSSLYGTVYGTATSRLDQTTRAGKPTIESASPWEVAETSAIGRALGMLGYGLLPGAGLASAEDMKRATEGEAQAEPKVGEYMFTWGKHKGTLISQVPEDYLKWALGKTTDADAKTAIREFLEGGVEEGQDEEVDQTSIEEELERAKAAVDEMLEGKKSLAGSTAFWARARGLKISTPDGKSHLKNYTGEDGRIDWPKAIEALGKEG